MRFFAGLKPLQPFAYASLLRAIARAVLEVDLVPVTRDVRHDPVELIAAALEVSIEQWDAASMLESDGSAHDLAARIAAFELLFGMRVNGERWEAALEAIAGPIEDQERPPRIAPVIVVRDQARVEVSAAVTAMREHREAALVEIVVVGARHGRPRDMDARTPKAVPLARGMSLVRAEKFPEALAVFEEILHRVPGHTLALQQAARCCVVCGAFLQAEMYSRRASGGVRRRQRDAGTTHRHARVLPGRRGDP
ncbi:MAG TPA: hypothetical protein VGF94_08840 [Kofleriaceae bacterium]|jgi:hypothetical protein